MKRLSHVPTLSVQVFSEPVFKSEEDYAEYISDLYYSVEKESL